MKKRKPQVTKREILSSLNANLLSHKVLNKKVDDLDMLFAEYIEFSGKRKEFEKYLDGKYKQREHKRSWGSITISK